MSARFVLNNPSVRLYQDGLYVAMRPQDIDKYVQNCAKVVPKHAHNQIIPNH